MRVTPQTSRLARSLEHKGAGWPQVLALLTLLVAGSILGLSPLVPLAALPADAPASVFAAGRALAHVQVIARAPHPVGSAAHTVVEAYLRDELTALGLTPEVQASPALIRRGGMTQVATLHTIVARLPGSYPGSAVALVAHYDSVFTGPGASDNASQVAMLLEVARVLRAGPQLRNDLLFIFTDGEEDNLLGAKAFAQSDLARQVRLALNFESVGTGGPALLFETSANNGPLVAAYAAAPRPAGNSALGDLYHTLAEALSNATDLTPLMQAGMAGMNIAHIAGRPANHTLLDNVAMLDHDSVQHQGETALALARHFGAVPLAELAGPSQVYFPLLPGLLVRYPATFAVPLALLLAVVAAVLTASGWRRGRLTARGVSLSAAIALAAIVLVAVLASALWGANVALRPDYRARVEGSPYNGHIFLWAFLALTLAVVAALQGWARRRTTPAERLAGALAWSLPLLLAASWWAPGSSYLLAWPLVALTLLLGWLVLRAEQGPWGWGAVAALGLAALPALVLLGPMILMLFQIIGLSQPYSPEVPMLGVWVLGAGLLLSLLAPQLDLLARPLPWALPAGALALGLGLLLVGNFAPGRSVPAEPAPSSYVVYRMLPDEGRAFWTAAAEPVAGWRAQLFGPEASVGPGGELVAPLGATEVRSSPAPVAPLEAPQLEVLEDVRTAQGRRLRVRVRTARGAEAVRLFLPAAAAPEGISVDGLAYPMEQLDTMDSSGAWLLLPLLAPPAEGVVIDLLLGRTGALQLFVADRTEGPPKGLATASPAAPPSAQDVLTDVWRVFTLPAVPDAEDL